MHELLERLGRGDARVMDMCARANTAWGPVCELALLS